jgi:hypothetical protein
MIRNDLPSVQEPSWARVAFLLGVSMLFTHELDAMTHAEWRVLPLTSWLDPEFGRIAFVGLHVPIFSLVLGLLTSKLPERARRAQVWIAAFMVAHAALHFGFSGHPAYTFAGVLSNGLIFGSAALSTAYLWGTRKH